MSDLILTKLILIVKNRKIRGYKGLSKDDLLRDLNILVKTSKEADLSILSFSELKLIAKVRRIKNYESMSKYELLSAFKNSIPFKGVKEIKKENRDENKIIRDLRVLCEAGEGYYKPQKQMVF